MYELGCGVRGVAGLATPPALVLAGRDALPCPFGPFLQSQQNETFQLFNI